MFEVIKKKRYHIIGKSLAHIVFLFSNDVRTKSFVLTALKENETRLHTSACSVSFKTLTFFILNRIFIYIFFSCLYFFRYYHYCEYFCLTHFVHFCVLSISPIINLVMHLTNLLISTLHYFFNLSSLLPILCYTSSHAFYRTSFILSCSLHALECYLDQY